MENTLTFLGTAGARVMVATQMQDSGAIWVKLNGTEILLDPAPGTIVQATRRKLRADKLQAIVLSHRHLDHSGDMNIMIEAMTEGGFKPHGRVFLPADALGSEPVVFSYLKEYIDGIEILQEGKSYKVDEISFSTPLRHIHGVETFGMVFASGDVRFSYVADSRYFDRLVETYRAELIVLNVVFMDNHFKVDHLSMPDAERIIAGIRPKTAILTHFGVQVYRAGPAHVAAEISQRTGVNVIAATDGMVFNLDEVASSKYQVPSSEKGVN